MQIKKSLQQQIDFELIKISLIFAALFCLLFNIPVFMLKFRYLNHLANSSYFLLIAALVKDFIYLYTILFILFLGITVSRMLFHISSVFLFLTGSIASYLLFFFNIVGTKSRIGAVFDLDNIIAAISIKLILWIIFSVAICIYSIHHFKMKSTDLFLTRILSALCLLFIVYNLISPQFSVIKLYFPTQYLHSSYLYFIK